MFIGIVIVAIVAAIPVVLSFTTSAPFLYWPLILIFFLISYWMGQTLERAKHRREAAETYHLLADSRRIRDTRYASTERPGRHAQPEPETNAFGLHPQEGEDPDTDPGLTLNR